jgi:hypothetical protein
MPRAPRSRSSSPKGDDRPLSGHPWYQQARPGVGGGRSVAPPESIGIQKKPGFGALALYEYIPGGGAIVVRTVGRSSEGCRPMGRRPGPGQARFRVSSPCQSLTWGELAPFRNPGEAHDRWRGGPSLESGSKFPHTRKGEASRRVPALRRGLGRVRPIFGIHALADQLVVANWVRFVMAGSGEGRGHCLRSICGREVGPTPHDEVVDTWPLRSRSGVPEKERAGSAGLFLLEVRSLAG